MVSTDQNTAMSVQSRKITPFQKGEDTTETTPLPPSESQGLVDLITPTPDEPGRVAETLQRAQLDSHSRVDKAKETKRKSPPSPVCTCQYALEVRILIED